MLDNAYASATLTYTCPSCCKSALDGLPNFVYHYRNYQLTEIDVRDIIDQWDDLQSRSKLIIKNHIFPFIDIFNRVAIGPIAICSGRGITNPYNNCWASAIFHILCGTVIFRLLPLYSQNKSELCRDMNAITRELHARSGTLTFSSAMKRLTSRVMGCDQTRERRQNDACEFYQKIIRGFLDVDKSNSFSDHFSIRTANLSKCLS